MLIQRRSLNSGPRSRLLRCLIPLLGFYLAGCCSLQPQSGDHEIDIRFVNGGGQEPLIEPASGWPLTLSLTANEDKLLGIWNHTAEEYPRR